MLGKSMSERLRDIGREPKGKSLRHRLWQQEIEATRPNAAARGYDAEWQVLRAAHLATHPYCVVCGIAATTVDHIKPHRGDDELRLDPDNLQSTCTSCHSSKTASRDGGFGNRRK